MQKWTKTQIRDKLNESDAWVERGIVAIYNRQAEDEKNFESTFRLNKQGFSSAHAKLGSYLARWILKGNHLSGEFVNRGRKLILHYTSQLTAIANGSV